ncbi:MAG: DUF2520 domain-containing protein, partial [Acidobacteriota bacterium]|nr:DUF2520 domain-containing protein [Acidobacteriota bacterium]
EGNATSSSFLRLPSLSEELGPVKAGALRVARRLTNFLRAGYPVRRYEELQPAGLIFLSIPDAIAPRIVEELCSSDLALKGISFVLCETWLNTNSLKPLHAKGAWTATVASVPSQYKSWFVVEGQLTAVRQVRKFLERNNARGFELRPGAKSLYFAAELLATSAPLQLLATAQQALRAAGISGNHVYDLLEEMSSEMFRAFSNGARPSVPATRTGCSPELSNEYFEQLRTNHPQIATLLDQQIQAASFQQKARPARESSDLPGELAAN